MSNLEQSVRDFLDWSDACKGEPAASIPAFLLDRMRDACDQPNKLTDEIERAHQALTELWRRVDTRDLDPETARYVGGIVAALWRRQWSQKDGYRLSKLEEDERYCSCPVQAGAGWEIGPDGVHADCGKPLGRSPQTKGG